MICCCYVLQNERPIPRNTQNLLSCVAARARVVVELADTAQLRAAGARDGDERRQHHPPDHDTSMSVDEAQHLVGVALDVVGRAVAVDRLPGLLLVLGSSHGLGLALRGQVSLPKLEEEKKTECGRWLKETKKRPEHTGDQGNLPK